MSVPQHLRLRGEGRRMKPDICIYHGNCADGFSAAWAVWKRFGDSIQYHPGVYGESPPDLNGKNVIIVDFSYKRPVLNSLIQSGDIRQAMTILILDHHKTAAADLADIKQPEDGYHPLRWRAGWENAMEWPVRSVFDMERSGAQIAWDFFHPGVRRPKLIDYVADRDLWRFWLPESRAVAAWTFSHKYSFAVWDDIADQLENKRLWGSIVDQGDAIERKHHKDIDELLGTNVRTMLIGGYQVPVANLPYTMASDAAGKLAKGKPFAACYFDRRDSRVFSLRSSPDGIDVSEIAKMYGGGGHKNASGFEVPLGWSGDVAAAA